MDFNQIRYFLALAEELNFTRAAERAHISQPTLTQSIQRLEDELGGPLIHRDGRRTRLTALGEGLLADFMAADRIPDRMRRRAREILTGRRAFLRLGIADCVPAEGPARFLRAFAASSDRVTIETETSATSQIETQLRAGTLDAAFLGPHVEACPTILQVEIAREAMVLALPPDHSLGTEPKITPRALHQHPWIDRVHCPLGRALTATVARTGEPKTIVSVQRDDLAAALVRSGLGVSYLPSSDADRWNLDRRDLATVSVTFRTYLCLRTDSADQPELAGLVSLARTFAQGP